ncbi:MAG: tetratricopeptide repeat protein, partial [Deltaproteobacteria bacterium]
MKKRVKCGVALAATIFVLSSWNMGMAQESADQLFEKGLALEKAGKSEQALELFEKGLMVNPRHYRSLLASGAVHYSKGDYRKAARRFEELVAFYPKDTRARVQLGHAELALGSIEEAKNVFRKILIDEPNNVSALIGLGRAEYLAGDRFTALDTFKKALALQPKNRSLAETVARLEDANKEYLRASEEERRLRVKSAVNNAIAGATLQAARMRAQAEQYRTPLDAETALLTIMYGTPV